MKLLFKQRMFSWFDSYDIYDENENTVYVVKGQLSWGHCLKIFDTEENELGTVKQEVLTWLPKFELYEGENYIGCLEKELGWFKPKYNIDFNGWHVEGDFPGWDYTITKPVGETVATVSKELLQWTDTYVLDHIHYFFEFTGCIPTVFSMLGRLSAPLFLFCTVEGFAHTHDRRRYFIRIWGIGTAMAALEFFMIYAKAFRRGDGFYPLNAIFQDLMLLCIVWQGIDWLREKKWVRGVAAIAAVAGWPFVIMAFLSAFPQIQQMPWASTVVAFVITSPLPLWTSITDGSWSFLLGGALLYALRGRRKVQLTVWALVIFLCDFVLTFGMACRQEGFVWTQMFTNNYEWFGVAAVLLMLLYNGQRGSGHKQLFYWFYPAHVYLLYGASCLVYNALR